jgi:pseudaminic acid cytidylyltransferase
MKKINRLLIIPARGNSKRIKNKNIKFFCGKPIIYYTIDCARKSKLFDKIHVSTESKKIFKCVKKKKIFIDFLREKKFSLDKTPVFDVIEYVLNKYKSLGYTFNEIWTISACAPLIFCKDLIKASKLIKKYPNKIILPVCSYNAPIEWAFKFKKQTSVLIPEKLNAYSIRSQDLVEKFYDTGDFICFKYSEFNRLKKKPDINYVGLKMPKSRSVDIDNSDDWKFAEKLFKLNN